MPNKPMTLETTRRFLEGLLLPAGAELRCRSTLSPLPMTPPCKP